MESLITDFVLFSCAFAKFLVLKGILAYNTKVYMHSILKLS